MRASAVALVQNPQTAGLGGTLADALQASISDIDYAPITRTQHEENARYLVRYFGDRPVADFAGAAGGELVIKYAQDETGGRDRGLREAFGGPGNNVPRLTYCTLRKRLCALRLALLHAFQRGELASMPTPWPVARPGSHGHKNAGKYLLGPEREAAIRREPAPVHRSSIYASKSDQPMGALPAGAKTLGNALDYMLAHGLRRVTQATYVMRTEQVRWLKSFFGADRPLSEFSGTSGYRLLTEFVEKEGTDRGGRGLKFVTLKKRLTALRMALTEMVRRGELDSLPLWPSLPKDGTPRERYLTLEEYRGILATITPPWGLWVTIGVWTGQHTSDIDTMTWGMVDLGAGPGNGPGPGPAFWLRRNTKNKKRPVWLPMPDELREALTAAYRRNPPAGPNLVIIGKCHNMRSHLKRACRKLGIPRVSPIDLRRTCATWWIEKGGPKDGLRQWLGHSVTSEMVERHYAQVTPAMVFGGVDALNRAARDPGSPMVVMGPRLLGPALDEGRV